MMGYSLIFPPCSVSSFSFKLTSPYRITPLFLQDFHHDVTLKQVLVLYLTGIKTHSLVHRKEVELADDLLK